MNTVYAMIYIVAAALVVTVAFLVVTALTPPVQGAMTTDNIHCSA